MTARTDLPPSDWVRRWSHLVPADGTVLDVACGGGRHLAWFARRGHAVTGVDRDADALARAAGALDGTRHRLLQADIEGGAWPFDGERFEAVVVTHYLWRPLLPALVAAVAPGGVLLYETFAVGNERHGKPSRPDFLLAPGELLAACDGLAVVAYEAGERADPPRCLQRVAAVRPVPGAPWPQPALPG